MRGRCALNNWGFKTNRFTHRVLAASLTLTLTLSTGWVPLPAFADVFSGISGIQLQDLPDNLVQLVFQADLPFEYQVKVLNANQVLIRLRTAQLASTLKTISGKSASGLLNVAPTASVTAVSLYSDLSAPPLSETLLLEGPDIGTKKIQVQGALLNLNPFELANGSEDLPSHPITALHLSELGSQSPVIQNQANPDPGPQVISVSGPFAKRLAQAKHLPPMPVKPVTPPKQNRVSIVKLDSTQLETRSAGAPAFDTIPFNGKQPFYKPLALSPNPVSDGVNSISANTPVITASAEKGLSIESLKPLPRYRGGAPPIQFTVSTTGETFTLPSAPVGVIASAETGKLIRQAQNPAARKTTQEQVVYRTVVNPLEKMTSEKKITSEKMIPAPMPASLMTSAMTATTGTPLMKPEKKISQSAQPIFPVKPPIASSDAIEAVAALHVAESLDVSAASEDASPIKQSSSKQSSIRRLAVKSTALPVERDEDDLLALKTTLKLATDAQSNVKQSSRVPQLLQDALEQVRQRGFDAARQKVMQAQAQEPENPKVHAALAEIAVCQNQWQAAELAYAKATRLAHEAHEGYVLDYRYAVVLAQLGKREKAIERLQAVVGENPNHASAQALLGKLYQALGETDQALRQYQESLAINPKQPEIQYELGLLYELDGKRQLAAEHYAQAKSLRPEDVMMQRAYQRVIGHAKG